MEKHIAVVHIDAPDEERNTRIFLMMLSFKNVRDINTIKFTCLLNNKENSGKEITKAEFTDAINKFLKLGNAKQDEILKECCTFVNDEEETVKFKFELPQQKNFFEDVNDEIEYDREIHVLESRLKYCKNPLEKQQITRELQSLKMWSSRKRGGKPRNKKKR